MVRVIMPGYAPHLCPCTHPCRGRGVRDDEPGHSSHGSAFDSGMRTRPWEMGDWRSSLSHHRKTRKCRSGSTRATPCCIPSGSRGRALVPVVPEARSRLRDGVLEPRSVRLQLFAMGSPNFDDKEFDRYKVFLKEAVRGRQGHRSVNGCTSRHGRRRPRRELKEGRKVLVEHLQQS